MKPFKIFSILFRAIFFSGIATFSYDAKCLTRIIVSSIDQENIKVQYDFDRMCNSLAFKNPYGELSNTLRKEWRSIDGCGTIFEGNILKTNKSCRSLILSIPVRSNFSDRVYPTTFSLADKGVLIHTGLLAVESSCGSVQWDFISKNGEIVINNKKVGKQVHINSSETSDIDFTGVFIGYQKSTPKRTLIINTTIPKKVRDEIIDADIKLTSYYRKNYPQLNFTPPAIFVNNIISNGRPLYQADVSSRGMMRFGFYNYPDERMISEIPNIKQVMAHEYAHILQPKLLLLKSEPIVYEGGAEFISWIAAYRLGWTTKNQLAADLADKSRLCLAALKESSWRDLPPPLKREGRVPYNCGLLMYVITLSSSLSNETSEKSIGDFYSQANKLNPDNWTNAFKCIDNQPCTDFLLSNFLLSEQNLTALLDSHLEKLGIVLKKSIVADDNNLLSFSQTGFQKLMSEDCLGSVGFWTRENYFLVDDVPQCKNLKANMQITYVENVSYFLQPIEAIHAQTDSCIQKGEVVLGTLEGNKINVKCTSKSEPDKYFYTFDIVKLLTQLGKQ